jgi:hypothetical protein
MMNAQFVYTKQSVSPMLFRPEVLGTETPVTLGGHSGQVCLPRLDSTADDKGFHHMLAPVNLGVGVLPLVYDRRDPISWGRQIVSPGCESIIGACLFEFELAKVDLKARDQMAEIERCVDLWFGLVRDWVEVTTNQDLSIDEPLSGTANDVNYEWSWLARTTWRSTIASSFMGRAIFMPDLSTAITRQNWQKVVQFANQGKRPPEPHLLLRDARARFKRNQYSYSAIFAGIAAEIVIKNQIETELRVRSNPQLFIDQIVRDTLGKLLEVCKSLGISLPTNVRTDLIKTRNRAVHKNAVISREDAKKALELASKIVVAGNLL